MNKETKSVDDNRVLIAFKPSHGGTEYQVTLDKVADTIWATELQIADVFGRDERLSIGILEMLIEMEN